MDSADPWPLPEPPHDLRAYVAKARCEKVVSAIHQASFKGNMAVWFTVEELLRLPEGYIESLRAKGFEVGPLEMKYEYDRKTHISWGDEREKQVGEKISRQTQECNKDIRENYSRMPGKPLGAAIHDPHINIPCAADSDYD